MDILRKSLAPISDKAWEEINEEAKQTLTTALSARKFIDVDGPKGFDFAAVPTGRIDTPKNQEKNSVQYGTHSVMPLIEARIPFELDIWELDNVLRGNENINLDNLVDAAKKIARFEDEAIYKGFKPANIEGLLNISEHKDLQLTGNYEKLVDLLSQAIISFRNEAVKDSYTLVVGYELYKYINSYNRHYPLRKHIETIINGKIILSDHIENAILVANRGGDFRLTLGQDFSIGYESHTSQSVQLYLTESFTFQVLDPAAVIVFR
ncbi:MAG: family 1 encapsulin nanocompartment shell protein [Bacteroidales bacterium]|nr:family 1 encapsulin nanocompartment shell protein [Bacteroidales bacterium]